MKIVSSDGQLSIDNMDVAPVRVGGGTETLQDKVERSYRALRLGSDMSFTRHVGLTPPPTRFGSP